MTAFHVDHGGSGAFNSRRLHHKINALGSFPKAALGWIRLALAGLRQPEGSLLVLVFLTVGGCDSEAPTLPALYQQPTPAIVLMGDSITYRWAFATPSILQLLPTANDEGVSGNTAAMMLARFHADVLDQAPQTLVLEAGTNDVLTGVDDFVDLQTMADEASQAGIHVILCTIPPSPMLNQSAVEAWNAQVAALAQAQGYGLADYASAAWVAADFDSDNEHPDNAGYALMGPILKAALGLVSANGD